MPRKLTPPEPWWVEATDLMVRCNISLRQAAAELGIDLSIEEADNVKGRKLFQKALDEAKIAYYNEIGSNPRLLRDVVVARSTNSPTSSLKRARLTKPATRF
jgi:hypothetical protein